MSAQVGGEDEWGTWLTYFGTNRISEDFSIHSEFEYNSFEMFSNFNWLWTIWAVNYHLDSKNSVSLGYGYFVFDNTYTDDFDVKDVTENRLFEQFTMNSKFKGLKFQHRYRLEHRFFNKANGTPTRHRFRYRLQLTHPISKRWFVNCYDEIFLDFREPVFNQNRVSAALGYAFTNDINVQAGYLKVHFPGSHYDRIQLVLNINTDLRKKEID